MKQFMSHSTAELTFLCSQKEEEGWRFREGILRLQRW